MFVSAVFARGGRRAAAAVLVCMLAESLGAQPLPPSPLPPSPPPAIAGKPIVDPQVTPAAAVIPPLMPMPPLMPVIPGESKSNPIPDLPAVKPEGMPPVALPADAAAMIVGHRHPHLYDSMHQDDNYGLKALFDTLHPPSDGKGKHWYDKFSIKGYFQFRFVRTVDQAEGSASPFQTGDRGINGDAESFYFRRARIVLSGDVTDHLYLYWQQEWAITLPGTTNPDFAQIRDLYADVYLDKTKVHRIRVGQSKIPYGWDNLQSSQNRFPLDRSDAINSGAVFVERDLGVFYYWTPEEKQKLFKDLVDGGLKGSGNYGIFGAGVYHGQGLAVLEQNLNLHTVARLTYPWMLESGQVVETSIQGYTGEYVVAGAPIRALGVGPAITPRGTGGFQGFRDQRIAATFVWYPQPFGIQTEWNYGEGPGLNDAQNAVEVRPVNGGYITMMFKHDTLNYGILTPYVRYHYLKGGYKGFANAPYGRRQEYNLGVEWQIRKEMELTVEYSFVNGTNLNPVNQVGVVPYRDFDGGTLRAQFQVNY